MKKYMFLSILFVLTASTAFAYNNTVTYLLSNTPGAFLVKMEGDIPVGIHNLVIFSSSDNTTFEDILAREMPDEWQLDVQTIYEGMPKIHAFIDTPVAAGEDRDYDIDATFVDDNSLYEDGDSFVFSRKSNFSNITVVIPKGYTVVDAGANMVGVSSRGFEILTLDNPTHKMVTVYVKFKESDSLTPAYPEFIEREGIKTLPSHPAKD